MGRQQNFCSLCCASKCKNLGWGGLNFCIRLHMFGMKLQSSEGTANTGSAVVDPGCPGWCLVHF